MKANKVVFGAVSIMDISDSTVTPETLGEGATAYDKSGEKITGTMKSGIDTSDATATASDMAQGVTAYVNGEKVTGTVLTISQGQSVNYPNATLYEDKANNKIGISGKAVTPTLLRQSATVQLEVSTDSFGDATATDVAAGKTFTSEAGVKVTGTMEPGVELPELTNPASASDIVKGKEAIGADGNVITGEVLAVNGFNTSMIASGMSVNGTDLVMTSHQYGSFMLNAGSDIVFKTPLNLFGDATAADVAAGKTFTSAAGLKVVGTAESGGGSGGGSVDTCTVNITSDLPLYDISYVRVGNNEAFEAVHVSPAGASTYALEQVVCNTAIAVTFIGLASLVEVSGGTKLHLASTGGPSTYVFTVTENATVNIAE